MDPFSLEVSVHRVGGTDKWPDRSWGPWVTHITPGGRTHASLPCNTGSQRWIEAHFSRWVTVRPGLLSAEAELIDANGMRLSNPRPVLVSLMPSDVPLYSAHMGRTEDAGVFSLGLRLPRSTWHADDVAEVEKVMAHG